MFFRYIEKRERALSAKYNEGVRREKEGGLGRGPRRPLTFASNEGRMKMVYNTMPEEPYLDELNSRHVPPVLQLTSVRTHPPLPLFRPRPALYAPPDSRSERK
jgi:hypothetical protein